MVNPVILSLLILFIAIFLWFTKLIPPAITSFVVIFLFSVFGILTFEESASSLGEGNIWLIIAMLTMGITVEQTNLDKRLAFHILALAKGSVRLILLYLIVISFLLSFFIPNAVGRLTVLLPLGLGIINTIQNSNNSKDDIQNIAKSVILTITFAPYISTIGLMTASSGAIYAVGLFETMLNYTWSYLYWMAVMIPIVLVTLFIFWLILIWKFPIKITKVEESYYYFNEEKSKLGSLTIPEKKLILLYLLLILLWITKGLHHMSIPMSALFVVILLFIPGINLVKWSDVRNKIDWSIPLLFSAGFTLAKGLESGGVVAWLSSLATSKLNGLSALAMVITIIVVVIIIRIGFTNYTAMVASLMPVALTFAVGTPYNPVWLGMVFMVAGSVAFLFPQQSIGSMTTYALGYYTSKDMLVVGGLLTIVIAVITVLAAFFYWPLLGLA